MWRLYDEVGRQGLAVKGIALPGVSLVHSVVILAKKEYLNIGD